MLSLLGLLSIVFIYRFAFRDDFEILEQIQISVTSITDVLLIAGVTWTIAKLIQALQEVKSAIIKWALVVLGVVGVYVLGVRVMIKIHYLIYLYTIGLTPEFESVFFSVSYQIFDTYIVVATGIVFLVGLDFFNRFQAERRRANQIRQEQIQSELNYLKAQINPHFIFNTLNNIYFSVDEKDTTARELIEDFSELLRYQLYETGQPKVPLENEAAFIKKYISVQRVRKEQAFEVNVHTEFSNSIFIAPLLLIIPLENAFKYSPSEDGFIDVSLTSADATLTYSVKNNIDARVKPNPSSSGLGISNLKKRLALIYGDRAQFSFDTEEGIAHAHITIKLTEDDT